MRLTLDLSRAMHERLTSLAEEADTSKAGLLRKGIALLSVAIDAEKKGLRLSVTKDTVVLFVVAVL